MQFCVVLNDTWGSQHLNSISRSDKPLIPVTISPWLDSQSFGMLIGSYPLSWRNLSVITLRMAQRGDHLIKERSEPQSESYSLSLSLSCTSNFVLIWVILGFTALWNKTLEVRYKCIDKLPWLEFHISLDSPRLLSLFRRNMYVMSLRMVQKAVPIF